ncbi:hypothetical protein Voc01_077750 [Virgisporangium ochraceum]|uniref:Uncharacterized protein n=1 Tax=Virgisporangium ochraceum TaxID=65505 RepID=A0A8J4A131_9ACTN|nr:hypothetical protein Voc01_077750 [Virgisporangium ochraceum]
MAGSPECGPALRADVVGGEVAGGLDGRARVHRREPVNAVLPCQIADEPRDDRRPVEDGQSGGERTGGVAAGAESRSPQGDQREVYDRAEGRSPGRVVDE